MGSALLSGILTKNIIKTNSIHIVEPNKSNRNKYRKYGLSFYKEISDVSIKQLKINTILIAVKPQIAEQVITDLKLILDKKVLIITVIAGKSVNFYEQLLSIKNIVRAMPNTPAQVGKGITALYSKHDISIKNLRFVNNLFLAVGEVVWIKKERDMHIVTAISGSGPAYVFKFIEIMIESAIKAGLKPKISERLVKNTLMGSSILAFESTFEVKRLREDVTSPGGTTEAAIAILEDKNQFSKIIDIAIQSAIKRSIDLS